MREPFQDLNPHADLSLQCFARTKHYSHGHGLYCLSFCFLLSLNSTCIACFIGGHNWPEVWCTCRGQRCIWCSCGKRIAIRNGFMINTISFLTRFCAMGSTLTTHSWTLLLGMSQIWMLTLRWWHWHVLLLGSNRSNLQYLCPKSYFHHYPEHGDRHLCTSPSPPHPLWSFQELYESNLRNSRETANSRTASH